MMVRLTLVQVRPVHRLAWMIYRKERFEHSTKLKKGLLTSTDDTEESDSNKSAKMVLTVC